MKFKGNKVWTNRLKLNSMIFVGFKSKLKMLGFKNKPKRLRQLKQINLLLIILSYDILSIKIKNIYISTLFLF